MRAVPLNGELDAELQPEVQVRPETMRSWLHNGAQIVDRRRRFGGHSRARELLVLGPEDNNGIAARWQALASALNRHTVTGGLSELTPQQRHVITLAYLEGQTNKQIAAALGVSVTTARRRLWGALQRLEAYITGVGVWLTAFAVAVGIYASAQSVRVVRLVAGMDRMQKVGATLAAGAVAAGAVGIVALHPATSIPARAAAPPVVGAQAGLLPTLVALTPPIKDVGWHNISGQAANVISIHIAPAKTKDNKGIGCHGNPTGAPPVTPDRSHGSGPPITPPGRGGCKARFA